jgi:signal transduction protein with GAF and PtsI domain
VEAKVKPLYKKGDGYDVQNYRPKSVLSIISKLLERMMFNRLIHFLSDNRIFREAQNGVRKGKSTETAFQSFIERIQEALDKGLHLIGNFFYLTKTYNV